MRNAAGTQQPSIFHPSSVLASTPLGMRTLNGRDAASRPLQYDSPIKGHKIRSAKPSNVLHDPLAESLGEPSSIRHETTLNSVPGDKLKSSPLASLGEVMRMKSQVGSGNPSTTQQRQSRRVVHSPPPTTILQKKSEQSPNIQGFRPKSPVVKERAPTLTNALDNLNLNSLLNKSPILREKFMRIQRERDTSPLKEPDGQWIVQSPEKEAYQTNPTSKKCQELNFNQDYHPRQASPVRGRNEIDTSDLSEVSPTKRRRTDSPTKRERNKQSRAPPPSAFRPITPPNQWAKVQFAEPEQHRPIPRKISPLKKPVVTNDAPRVSKSSKEVREIKKDTEHVMEGDNRRPKLMSQTGQLHKMPKSPDERRLSSTASAKASVSNSKWDSVPDILQKAMQTPEEFLLSLARSSAHRAVVEEASEGSQRSGSSSRQSTRHNRVKQHSGDIASPRSRPGFSAKSRPVADTEITTKASKPKTTASTKTVQRQPREPRPTEQERRRPTAPEQRQQQLSQQRQQPPPTTAQPRLDHGGARPKTGPALEKWKRPTHMKPQAATTRNLTRDLAAPFADARSARFTTDLYGHLDALNQCYDAEDEERCLGLSTHDDTLDEISSIASLRSIEADHLPINRPAPSDVRIADTSSTAWTKTRPDHDLLDTSSTRRLVEQIQVPKVKKTYRNLSPSKKPSEPQFLPIDPAQEVNEADQSLVVPKVITQVVVDKRTSPKKSPVKKSTRTDVGRKETKPKEKSVKKSPGSVRKPEASKKTPTKSGTESVRSSTSSLRQSQSSHARSTDQAGKKTKRQEELELISSLKDSLKNEIANLLQARQKLEQGRLAGTESLTASRDFGRGTSNGASENAQQTNDLSPVSTPLRRAGTYDVVNESLWGDDLDTVPTSEPLTKTSEGASPVLLQSARSVPNTGKKYSPAKENQKSSVYESASSSPRRRAEESCSDTMMTYRSTDSEWASAMSVRSQPTARAETYATPTTTPKTTPSKRHVSALSERKSERGTDRRETSSERETLSLSESAGKRAFTPLSSLRSEPGLKLRDSARTTVKTSSSTVELKIHGSNQVSPNKRLTDKNEDDRHFEAQKLDLKASLKGVKEKLEHLRADLQMTPRLADDSSESARTPRSLAASMRSTTSTQRTDLPLERPTENHQNFTPRSDSNQSLKTVSSSTPSNTSRASQRLDEIEETMRRRQERKERESVLVAHENHLIRLAAQCQREMALIKRVRRGEVTYDDYGREMVDSLAERLENLHLLKSKVLLIPRK